MKRSILIGCLAVLALAIAPTAHADDTTPPPPPPAPTPNIECHNIFPPGLQPPWPYQIQRCPGT